VHCHSFFFSRRIEENLLTPSTKASNGLALSYQSERVVSAPALRSSDCPSVAFSCFKVKTAGDHSFCLVGLRDVELFSTLYFRNHHRLSKCLLWHCFCASSQLSLGHWFRWLLFLLDFTSRYFYCFGKHIERMPMAIWVVFLQCESPPKWVSANSGHMSSEVTRPMGVSFAWGSSPYFLSVLFQYFQVARTSERSQWINSREFFTVSGHNCWHRAPRRYYFYRRVSVGVIERRKESFLFIRKIDGRTLSLLLS